MDIETGPGKIPDNISDIFLDGSNLQVNGWIFVHTSGEGFPKRVLLNGVLNLETQKWREPNKNSI